MKEISQGYNQEPFYLMMIMIQNPGFAAQRFDGARRPATSTAVQRFYPHVFRVFSQADGGAVNGAIVSSLARVNAFAEVVDDLLRPF